MTFIISLETLGHGSYLFGKIEVKDEETPQKTREAAQKGVVRMLVQAGFPVEKIGRQTTDYTTLHIGNGIHTISVVPIKEFDGAKAASLVALLR